MSKPTILFLSDSPTTNTGYATISRNILNGLSDEYDCHFSAHNYVGQPIPPGLTFADGLRLNFWLHGAGRAAYCQDIIQARAKQVNADAVGILLDTFMLYPWIANMNFSPAKTFFYFPSDGGGGLPQGCDQLLRSMNASVAMAKFGQRQAKSIHGITTQYIPHAVDTELFRPVSSSEKESIKANAVVSTVHGSIVKGALANKFVIGSVMRNQGRKMPDRLIKSLFVFKQLAPQVPNAVLYWHTDPEDAAAVNDVRFFIKRLGLENRVFFSPMKYYENVNYKDMPNIYNTMDVFLLSTSGEGFGIPIIEAMSCGIPSVVTDYSTTSELLVEDGVCGIPVPLVGVDIPDLYAFGKEHNWDYKQIDEALLNGCLTGSWNVERGMMDVNKAASALLTLYNDKGLREELGQTGVEKARRLYSWKVVIPQWKSFLKTLLYDKHTTTQ